MALYALIFMYARMRASMSTFSMREDTKMRPEEVTLASGATTFLFVPRVETMKLEPCSEKVA